MENTENAEQYLLDVMNRYANKLFLEKVENVVSDYNEIDPHYKLQALSIAQNMIDTNSGGSYTVDELLDVSKRIYEFIMTKNKV